MLEAYAVGAPVLECTTVLRVTAVGGRYSVLTDRGQFLARSVVIATGDCDLPRVPAFAASAPGFVHQVHARGYRNPAELPDGGVLIVGAGPSGQQIAAELRRAGRAVVLAAGRHARMPRRYRGRDAFAWLDAVGALDARAADVQDLAAARRAPSFPLSGASGGESLGLDRLLADGVVVCGRLEGFAGRHALFADDLIEHVRDADRRLLRGLARIDSYIEATGCAALAPDPPPALRLGPGPASVDLAREIRTIVWATGFRRAYPWLHVPVLDADGDLVHDAGVTPAPGLFAVGLRFQRTRKSHLIGGVGSDAECIAGAILDAAAPLALAA